MAVKVCKEIHDRRRVTDRSGEGGHERGYTRCWRVVMDEFGSGPGKISQTILASYNVPQRGDYYTEPNGGFSDITCLAVDFSVELESPESPYVYIATVDYSNKLPKSLVDQFRNNQANKLDLAPLDRPAKLTSQTVEIEIPAYFHFDEFDNDKTYPLRMVNGARPNPPVKKSKYVEDITITRFEAVTIDMKERKRLFMGRINDSDWHVYKKNDTFCKQINFEYVYEDGLPYHSVTYKFIHDPDPFEASYWPAILQTGTSEKDASGRLKVITDGAGKPITEPVLLGEDGKQLPITDPPAKEVYKFYKLYPSADFKQLEFKF